MRVQDCNWMQIERYLEDDDRVVIPLGCTEQHAYLSLSVDSILAERVAAEAAEPLGVPVMPVLAYGLTPYFAAYPGSPTLRPETYASILRDLLDSLHDQGFRRFLLVNGHGGNTPGRDAVEAWAGSTDGAQVRWHNWWNGPQVWEVVQAIDTDASHASWLESFPWTRLPNVPSPDEHKPMVDVEGFREADPAQVRTMLGDGSFGGRYQRSDEDSARVWKAGVEEVRELLEEGWVRA
jgi:creatinine amidohydrolase